jgi:enterochelin esterase-like enzyme
MIKIVVACAATLMVASALSASVQPAAAIELGVSTQCVAWNNGITYNVLCPASTHIDNANHVAALFAYDETIPDNSSGTPAGVTHHTYWSHLTQMNIGYNIYLPPEYFTQPNARFPVVYWFSGGQGDENIDPPNILPYLPAAGAQPTIFVFPNTGFNGWAMDPLRKAPMYGIWAGQSTITDELIPAIDAAYRTRATKGGRALQGMSGGGMKALRIAVVRPDLFSSVYGFAPAIDDNASNIATNEPKFLADFWNNNISLYSPHTVQNETTSNVANISGQIAIHLTVGTNDGLMPDEQAYDAQLTSLGIPHDPLTLISGAVHDLGQLLTGTSGTSADSFVFASNYFF